MDKKVFILRDNGIRDRCKLYLDTLPIGTDEKPMKVTVEPYKKNRSLAQNNLMWLWLTALSNFLRQENGLDTTPEDLKHYFQSLHLGFHSFELPTAPVPMHRIIGTSEINTATFTEFLNEIEVYAANVGLRLPHPEDIYYEAMGLSNDFR